MSDNVIILGAGASVAAGIPLLGGFMDQMWQMAKLGRCHDVKITDSDRSLLIEAMKVRQELDGYHGRAALDVWNIEEVLSLLSFNSLAGGKSEKRKMELMTKAIAKTIELSCLVKHTGRLDEEPHRNHGRVGLYEDFWHTIFAWCSSSHSPPPIIITFNYDLVLERSLLNATIGRTYKNTRILPSQGLEINYHTNIFPPIALRFKEAHFDLPPTQGWRQTEKGWILEPLESGQPANGFTEINLLKLHGSGNFPKPRYNIQPKNEGPRLVEALDDPLILPPIFNKATESVGADSWAFAMNALRKCKNLIVCGYSLPQTDIYMQYFLKAALGPNQDLNRIFVFDPTLFREDKKALGESLKQRYSSNFSAPIQKRIEYKPPCIQNPGDDAGTMHHLVWLLGNHPEEILFGNVKR